MRGNSGIKKAKRCATVIGGREDALPWMARNARGKRLQGQTRAKPAGEKIRTEEATRGEMASLARDKRTGSPVSRRDASETTKRKNDARQYRTADRR